MTTNSYFASNYTGTPDQTLHEDLIIESIQIYGIDVEYLPRSYVNLDELFGEDQSSKFEDAYTVEMYVKSVDGFGGDGNFLSRFGLEIRDEVQLTVSKRRFEETVDSGDFDRPYEGDIIQLPTTVDQKGRLYEITFVNYEEIFYQLGTLHTYEITAKVFELGGETFDTGDESIDDIMGNQVETQFLLTNGSGTFTVDEAVSSSGGSTAIVASWNASRKIVGLRTIIGEIASGETLTGANGASYEVVSKIGINIDNDSEDNTGSKDESEDIIDFSETNPFSK